MKKNVIYLLLGIMVLFNVWLLISLNRERRSFSAHILPEGLHTDKPALAVVFYENECPPCVNSLLFLNTMYSQIQTAGDIEFRGLVLSEAGKDSKRIAGRFNFPFAVTSNFGIMRRLKMNRTPLILGIAQDRIVYCDYFPPGEVINKEYIERSVLARLYYWRFSR